jgi:hypothetical protein
VALVPKLFAPDCIVHDPTIAGISGPDGVIRFVTMCRAAFPDLQLTIEDQLADGNKVATRFTLRGTQTGRFLDIAPTGKQVTVTGGTTWDCCNSSGRCPRWKASARHRGEPHRQVRGRVAERTGREEGAQSWFCIA